mgnify:CR=1 FL=1
MRYEHVMAAVCGEAWAIEPEKLREIVGVLAYRAAGHAFTPDEIQARIGARSTGVSVTGANVGVLPVRGTIAHRMGGMDESSGGVSTERLGAMLATYMADETIGAILLDIDSPGGTVTGVPELAAKILKARESKRVVALVNGLAASAGYWLASQAGEIVSIPSGLAGSIGVFTAHMDMSEKLAKEGVAVSVISAGKHKVEGMPFAPLTDDARAHVQARVDEAYGWFVRDVAKGRGVSVGDVREGYGQGRVLGAKEAKAAGLIDRIATSDEVVASLLSRRGSSAPMRAAADRLEMF